MFRHRFASLHNIQDVDELLEMPANKYRMWKEFYSLYPCGEEAMDVRFEVLRKDIADWMSQLIYTVNRSAGGKMPKPRFPRLDKFKIFKRGGDKPRKDFRSMSQAQIAKQMSAMARAMTKNG